ncbi:uncharacterized protein [Ptychodera flava]|uniref:uncharacterized protein n=1 Tax=Ptychodera flava TaxID=63121 RepID=UPI00396AA24C
MSDNEKDVEKGQLGEEVPLENQHDSEKAQESEQKDKLLDEEKTGDAVYTKDGGADLGTVQVRVETVEHVGLDKEQLIEQCNTPFWRAVRIMLLVLFWVAFVAMLVAVVILIATAPRCPRNKLWYQTGLSYQIYPRSFKDSGEDGIGDLQGIESKVPYLQELGVEAIWLGPIFPTPMQDMGRDISNFTAVDDDLGSIEDFVSLLAKVRSVGIRLVMEFIPNHSSDQHPWFELSKRRVSPYTNYYVWADSPPDNAGAEPSNWLSRYGGSAWTYSEERQQYYLHTFDSSEPDLNFRNENVTKEISNALKFWLELGVDGFYMPYANQLVENINLDLNEADNIYYKSHVNDTKKAYDSLLHNSTRDQPETLDLLSQWKALLDVYSGPDSDDYKLLVAGTPSSGIETQMMYYGKADFPYNFQLMDLCTTFDGISGHQISSLVTEWHKARGGRKAGNWALGDSDHSRVSSRCGSQMLRALNTLLLTLPGSPTAYYGDEIGMEDIDITSSNAMDPGLPSNPRFRRQDPDDNNATESNVTMNNAPPVTESSQTDKTSNEPTDSSMVLYYNSTRDRFVSPMQWSSEKFAGFTNGSIVWLEVGDNYRTNNVEALSNASSSSLDKFKELVPIVRNDPALIGGGITEVLVSEKVYSFIRVFDRWPGVFVAINLDSQASLRPFNGILKELPASGTIMYASHDSYEAGEGVEFNGLQMAPYEAVIVKFERCVSVSVSVCVCLCVRACRKKKREFISSVLSITVPSPRRPYISFLDAITCISHDAPCVYPNCTLVRRSKFIVLPIAEGVASWQHPQVDHTTSWSLRQQRKFLQTMGNKQGSEPNQQPAEESVAMNGDPEKGELETSPMNEKAQMEEEMARSEKKSEFMGLSRSELIEEGNTRGWKTFRTFLLVLMFLSWVLLAVAAVVIIVTVPRCPNANWWQKNAIYQVYPRSFQDSDGDGMGDIKGIESRLEHLEAIQAKTLLLSNIFRSDDRDLLFAITDFQVIDEQLGTVDDFKQLLSAAEIKGVKVVLEFIPNHSSDEHPWFVESRKSQNNDYSDFYIWADGDSDRYPPNNWVNAYGDSAWTYEPVRGQWYYHTYTSKQPDLNLRNETIKEEMKAVLEYWLKVGADGFIVKDASYLIEADDLEDEPTDPAYDGASDEYNKLLHSKTVNQPENYGLVNEWAKLVKGFGGPEKPRTMLVEPRGHLQSTMGYFGPRGEAGTDILYNHQFLDNLEGDLSGTNMHGLIDEWLHTKDNVTGIAVRSNSWVLGNMKNERVASRYGKEYVRALNALIFTLPGVPVTYYGEEIGMESLADGDTVHIGDPAQPLNNNTIPQNHAANISPMQWSSSENAGFSNASETWIPVHRNYGAINVEAQKDNASSTMELYRQMASLRQMPSLLVGEMQNVLATDELYAFTRNYPEWPNYFVAINVGDQALTENYRELDPKLPEKGTIVFSTEGDRTNTVGFDGLKVNAAETLVIKY